MYVYVYVCICICMYVFSCQNLCSGYCSFLPLLFEHIRDDNSCIIVYLLSFQSKQCVREHPSLLQGNSTILSITRIDPLTHKRGVWIDGL